MVNCRACPERHLIRARIVVTGARSPRKPLPCGVTGDRVTAGSRGSADEIITGTNEAAEAGHESSTLEEAREVAADLAKRGFRTVAVKPLGETALRDSTRITELDITTPGLELEDPAAISLWDETGNFIGTALARIERGKAFSIMLGRIQHELRDAYGVENARKVMQAIMDTMK